MSADGTGMFLPSSTVRVPSPGRSRRPNARPTAWTRARPSPRATHPEPRMPLFMDRHDLPGVTAEEVARAHVSDLQVQARSRSGQARRAVPCLLVRCRGRCRVLPRDRANPGRHAGGPSREPRSRRQRGHQRLRGRRAPVPGQDQRTHRGRAGRRDLPDDPLHGPEGVDVPDQGRRGGRLPCPAYPSTTTSSGGRCWRRGVGRSSTRAMGSWPRSTTWLVRWRAPWRSRMGSGPGMRQARRRCCRAHRVGRRRAGGPQRRPLWHGGQPRQPDLRCRRPRPDPHVGSRPRHRGPRRASHSGRVERLI